MGEIDVKVAFQDLTRLEDLIKNAGLKAPYAIAKAIDAVGNKTMTQVKRSVAAQAGVPVGKAGAVLSKRQAMGAGGGSFSIVARDVTLSLKEFGPRKTAKGISAAPWHKRRVFPHTFFGPGGHVFVREGKGRLPIKKLFGPNIPKEMVKDQTEQLFYAYTASALPAELEKWLFKALG